MEQLSDKKKVAKLRCMPLKFIRVLEFKGSWREEIGNETWKIVAAPLDL